MNSRKPILRPIFHTSFRRILFLAIFACVAAPAHSQSSGPSDVVIQVSPLGGGAMSFALTFPAKVSHKDVMNRLNTLSKSTGWRFSEIRIHDTDVKTSAQFGRQKSLGIWTDVNGTLTNAPQESQGGFLLQPYVETFSDLNRIQLMFWVPQSPNFRGIRDFQDSTLSVHLIQEGGPYRYDVAIHAHNRPMPQIPLLQPTASSGTQTIAKTSRVQTAETRGQGSALAAVVAIAAGAGFVVLVALLLFPRLRSGISGRPRPLRPPAG